MKFTYAPVSPWSSCATMPSTHAARTARSSGPLKNAATLTTIRLDRWAYAVASAATRATAPPSTRSWTTRIPSVASSRSSRIVVNVAAFYDGPEGRVARAGWVDGMVARLDQGDTGAYVNFIGDEGPG